MYRERLLLAVLVVASIASVVVVTSHHGVTAQSASAAAVTGGKSTGGNTSYEEPVTTVVLDFDTSGVPLLMRSDDYNGAGQATYTSIFKALTSEIGPNGNWKLDLFNQSVRTLWLTPNDAINSSQPAGPPAGYYWQAVEAYSQCYDQSGNIVPFENLTNGSNNCSLGVDFQPTSIKYKLVMSPHLPAPGPATGLASVACNAVNNAKCVNWTITPNAAAANATVANLYSWTGNPKQPWAYIGQYHNTYRINASYP